MEEMLEKIKSSIKFVELEYCRMTRIKKEMGFLKYYLIKNNIEL